MAPVTQGRSSGNAALPSRAFATPALSFSATAITSSVAFRAPAPTRIATFSPAFSRDLDSELQRLRDRVGDLRAVEGKLAAASEDLKRTTSAREDAAQREGAAISSRLEKAKDR